MAIEEQMYVRPEEYAVTDSLARRAAVVEYVGGLKNLRHANSCHRASA
jgi:hypothetical protein